MAKITKYEKRLTLFVDFLGFSEIVDTTVANPKSLDELINALADAAETASYGNAADFHATQFSDCLVISYKFERPETLFEIVNKLSLIVVRVAAQGYLIRGGLTYGDLLHTDKVVVGPAMIRAYQLESKIAQSPRVILDPDVFNHALKKPSADVLKTIKKFLRRDKDDGLWYFDYFSSKTVAETVVGEFDFYPKYLTNLSILIKRGLKHSSPSVLEKYVWMQKRYKAARKPFLGIAEDHSHRDAFPGYLESIENLPDLNKAAAKAVKIIAKAAKKKCKKL
jgi:hypothetical protein